MGIGGSFLGLKRQGSEADSSPSQLLLRSKNVDLHIYFSIDNFRAFHGTQRFNTEFTRALHLFLS
jgi:hypothetical protein